MQVHVFETARCMKFVQCHKVLELFEFILEGSNHFEEEKQYLYRYRSFDPEFSSIYPGFGLALC